ncbi:MAG: GH32 C-terminal domain-containing protein, partial [Lachnospiraceae bacterium]|nr:GH32 C-terminal domain-containing protein [Lachnospiraceae bacterium]
MGFRMYCKNRGIYLIAVVSMLIVLCTGCKGEVEDSNDLLLHLAFNEKSGTEVSDSAGKLQNAEVHYMYNNAVYMENQEPGWRDAGVEGSSLLFDGCSTYIDYSADELCITGDSLCVSVWVAPRVFEWDDPNAAENGTEHLTAIISQYDKNKNQGGTASLNHVSGPLMLEDGKLVMEIYIDRSLVEAFFNDTKSISMRSYSDFNSQGIQLFADGDILVDNLYVTDVQSIYS